MGYQIQVANAQTPIRFLLVLASDHITGATGKTPSVTIAKNGGSFAAPFGAISEVGNGFYQIAANAVDANVLGPLLLHATASACDPTDDQYDVVSYNPTSFSPNTVPSGPDSVTALDLITDALDIIGVRSQGETVSAADAQFGLRRLNQLIGQWSLMPLTVPVIARDVFTLTPGQGGPTNPYTYGIGGDFHAVRPTRIDRISIVLTGTSPEVEVPRTLLTLDAYQQLAVKDTTSTQFTEAYFQATYASGWAALYLYPVPTVVNDIAIYRPQQLSAFATLSAPYDLPPGAADAITYELARRLAHPYQRTWSPDLAKDASDYLAIYKRANTVMVDLSVDVALTAGQGSGAWDILTDA